MPRPRSARLFRAHPTETWLVVVLLVMCVGLSLASDAVLHLRQSLQSAQHQLGQPDLRGRAAGGADRRRHRHFVRRCGLGGSVRGGARPCARSAAATGSAASPVAAVVGIALGAVNAALIYYFRIISIVVTIATFNIFFGLLMFFTRGVSIYNLPDWWTHRTVLFEFQQANGTWAELTLPVLIMAVCVFATWVLIRHTDHRAAALRLRRQSRGRAAARHQYRGHALHRLRLARPDGGHRRAGAGALCAGGRAQRADRARARRACRRGARRRQARRRAAAPCSAASSACSSSR